MSDPSEIVNRFDFDLDRMLKGAWKERRAIGWDQLLKGQLSERWGNRTGNVLKKQSGDQGVQIC